MVFFTLQFFIFLALTLLLFHLKWTRSLRKWILFAASIVFYAAIGKWCLLWVAASAATVYCCARINTKPSFYIGLFFPLTVFLVFKYTPFVYDSFAALLGAGEWTLKWLLPVGISFYTFRLISYLVDVRKGVIESEQDPFYFFTYAAFFPLLLCGPIQRAGDFLPRIKAPDELDLARFDRGLRQILWGVLKKAVLADNLAVLVNETFSGCAEKSGFVFILAVLCYTVQIYCDFSGYSDMAIGITRLFGIDLKENFRVPYCSTTIKEFWSRWHISLSTWFRDYVYFPLGGGRRGKARRALNVMVTFLLSGLWHGANWTFLLWGGLHGAGLVLEKAFFDKEGPKTVVTKFLWTVFVAALVIFGWLFFRADSISQACFMLTNAFRGMTDSSYLVQGFRDLLGGERGIVFLIQLILPAAFVFIFEHVFRNGDPWAGQGSKNTFIKVGFYALTVIMIVLFHAGEQQELIYGAF